MTTVSVAREAGYKKEKRRGDHNRQAAFVPCQAKEVKTKRSQGVVGEITWIVHDRKDGKITYSD